MLARTAGIFFMWEKREDQRIQKEASVLLASVVCEVAWLRPALWILLSREIILILSSGDVRRNRIKKTGLESADPMSIPAQTLNCCMLSLHPPLKL